jgi:hypothetical protein
MHYERRCATAVLVAIVATGLSMLLPFVMGVVFVALFLVALGLLVYTTPGEDLTVQRLRLNTSAWLACVLLGAAMVTPGSFGPLAVRALGAAALVDALSLWSRSRGPVPSAPSERSRSSGAAP